MAEDADRPTKVKVGGVYSISAARGLIRPFFAISEYCTALGAGATSEWSTAWAASRTRSSVPRVISPRRFELISASDQSVAHPSKPWQRLTEASA